MGKLNLDVSDEEARAIHRVVRALHDGHCPNCGCIAHASKFRYEGRVVHQSPTKGYACPNCKFNVTDEEAQQALKLFQPYLKKSVDVFKKWRKDKVIRESQKRLFERGVNPSLCHCSDSNKALESVLIVVANYLIFKMRKMKNIQPGVTDQIRELANRKTPITFEEWSNLRMNSYDREYLLPNVDDECFVKISQYYIDNCKPKRRSGPALTYDESVIHVLLPEALKRLKK